VVRLSAQGTEIGSGRRQEREKQWHRWLSHLSDDELDALARGLSSIIEVVKREAQDDSQQPPAFNKE